MSAALAHRGLPAQVYTSHVSADKNHEPTSVASQEEAESGPTKVSGTEAKCPALFQDAPPPSGARAGDSRGVLLATKGTTALSAAPSTTLHKFAGVSKPKQERGVSQVLCAERAVPSMQRSNSQGRVWSKPSVHDFYDRCYGTFP